MCVCVSVCVSERDRQTDRQSDKGWRGGGKGAEGDITEGKTIRYNEHRVSL